MKRSPLFIFSAILSVAAFWAVALFILAQFTGHAKAAPARESASMFSFEELSERGSRCYEQGDYSNAKKDFTEMIALQSNRAEGYRLRAMAEFKLDDFDSFVHDLTNTIRYETRPEEMASLYCLRALGYHGLLLSYNIGNDAKRKADLEQGVADSENALRRDPKLLSAYLERGWFHMFKRENESALSDLNIFLNAPAPQTRARSPLDALLISQNVQGRPTSKLRDTDPSLQKKAAAHMYRAYTYDNMNQLPKALPDVALAAVMDPDNAQYNNTAGWFFYRNGQTGHALPYLQRAVKQEKESPYPCFNLGLCYAVLGNAKASLAAYQQASPAAPTSYVNDAYEQALQAQIKQPNSTALKQAVALLKQRLHFNFPNERTPTPDTSESR